MLTKELKQYEKTKKTAELCEELLKLRTKEVKDTVTEDCKKYYILYELAKDDNEKNSIKPKLIVYSFLTSLIYLMPRKKEQE